MPPTPPFNYKPLTHLLGATGPIHALSYSSSPGSYILTGSNDRSIRLYNPFPAIQPPNTSPNPRLIQTYSGHGYEVLSLSVATDNATFASSGGDRSILIWDVSTTNPVRRLSGTAGHTARINSVSYAGTGDSILLSGSYDASVRIWDLRGRDSRPVQTLLDAKDAITAVMVNGARNWEIVSGSVDGRVRWYDLRTGRCDVDVMGAPVTSLSAMKGGEAVLVGLLGGGMRLMDRNAGTCLMAYRGHVNEEFRLRSGFGGREAWVLCGSEVPEGDGDGDGEVVVWDTVSGVVIKRVRVQGGQGDVLGKKRIVGSDGTEKKRRNVVSCVAWKNDGRGDQWCCAGTDGVVTVFGEG